VIHESRRFAHITVLGRHAVRLPRCSAAHHRPIHGGAGSSDAWSVARQLCPGWRQGRLAEQRNVRPLDSTVLWARAACAAEGSRRHVGALLDGHYTHTSYPSLKLLDELNVHVVVLPPHSSHVLQPCDCRLFAEFKRKLRDALRAADEDLAINAGELPTNAARRERDSRDQCALLRAAAAAINAGELPTNAPRRERDSRDQCALLRAAAAAIEAANSPKT
jgi:hypothetical protein